MIYYISDPHFGNEAVLKHDARPFASVQEMDATLIQNWNRVVTAEDTVYMLGDLGFHDSPIPGRQLARLAGHKHLIRGNHDTGLKNQRKLFHYFESVTDFLEIDDGGFHITLCHYPIVYAQRGYMIHGHFHHHHARPEVFSVLKGLTRVMNAAVDLNHFQPVTLDELIVNNQAYYQDPERGREVIRHGGDHGGWKAEFHPLPVKRQEGPR